MLAHKWQAEEARMRTTYGHIIKASEISELEAKYNFLCRETAELAL